MTIPKSPVVRIALGWLLFSAMVSIATINTVTSGVAEAVGSYLVKSALPYACGAFASGCGLVRVLAFAAGIVFAATVLVERFQSRKLAHAALGAFMLLSLLTLWFDTYITAALSPLFSAATAEAILQTAAASATSHLGKVFGMGVTGVWVFAWFIITREMDAELDEARLRRELSQDHEKLLRESLLPAPSSAPAIVGVLVVEVACGACGAAMPSTNRHCTRCGAPLRSTPRSAGGGA